MTDRVHQQSRLKALIAKGKEQGYLTYAEVNDHLPQDISDPDQVEDIIQMINDMGIQVFEQAPDADELIGVRCLLKNLNAHVVDHLDDVFNLIGIRDVLGEVIVDFSVGQVSLFFSLCDQGFKSGLLMHSVGHAEPAWVWRENGRRV